MAYRRSGDVTKDIRKTLGILSKNSSGWTKEANIVSWNGGAEVFDVRKWDPEHEKCSRGITLTEKEAEKLCDILDDYFHIKALKKAEDDR